LTGDESNGEILAPRLAQPGDGAPAWTGPEHSNRSEPFELGGVQVMRAVEVRCDSAVELEARAFPPRGPESRGFRLIRHARGLPTLYSLAAPPSRVETPLEPGGLEKLRGGGVASGQPHLAEALLFCFCDRGGEHRPGEPLAAVGARDSQPLVPDQAGPVGPQTMQADDGAFELSGLESGTGVRYPVIEHARDVVVPVPHVARDLRHAVAIRRPHRPEGQLLACGCQCAAPDSTGPPPKTKSPPSRANDR